MTAAIEGPANARSRRTRAALLDAGRVILERAEEGRLAEGRAGVIVRRTFVANPSDVLRDVSA